MKIAVVGAGWAGLAAASQCRRHGHEVSLFEASRTAGGRARRVIDPQLGTLDNGQHLMLGCYKLTLSLIQADIGDQGLETGFRRLPLQIKSADQSLLVKARNGGASRWNNLAALLFARGLSVSDKWALIRLLFWLSQGDHNPDPSHTVSDWLAQFKQPPATLRWLWHPLCLATMNTHPDRACATLFANVIKQSLLSAETGATDFMVPAVDLSELWPDHVTNALQCRFGHVVRSIEPTSDGVRVDGEGFDACVLATPAWGTQRLLEPLTGTAHLVADLKQFDYNTILTCYVGLQSPYKLPAPVLMLDHDPGKQTVGHWVFDRRALLRNPNQTSADLAFVVSDCASLTDMDDQSLAKHLVAELSNQLGCTQALEIRASRCIHEKRATFAAVPKLARPGFKTAWPHLVLAGDWTDTGLPAVIEGAVKSGLLAADALNELATNKG